MDWIAGLIELIAIWTIGNKNRKAFLLFIIGNILWSYIAIKTELYGLLLVTFPAILLNIRNYYKWQNKENQRKTN